MNITCLQMISSDSVDDNCQKIRSMLSQYREPIDFLVLPENFALMTREDSDKLQQAESLDAGPIQKFIEALAIEHDCWVCAGTIPLQTSNASKVYAASSIYSNRGERLYTYYKQCLFDVDLSSTESYRESDSFEAGTSYSKVLDSPIGRVGIAVCYDLRFAENFIALVNEGVEIILVPSAFTYRTGQYHWLPLLRARAIETQCYLVGCNQGGVHTNGRHTFGHSAIYDPYGESLAAMKEGEGLISAPIDLDYIKRVRAAMPMTHSRKMLKSLAL